MANALSPVKRKLSYDVAHRIARDIIDNGWEEGHLIGREPKLLERYSISRDTFREALRVLEWQGLIRTRRGRSGGLMVAKPSKDAILNILRTYLALTDITFSEVMEVRRRLERLAVRLATIRLTDEVVPRLQALLEESVAPSESTVEEIVRHLRLIHEIGRVSGNSVLGLFIAPLDYVAVDFVDLDKLSEDLLERTRASGRKILRKLVAAIVDNEEEVAIENVNDYIQLTENVARTASRSIDGEPSTYPQWLDFGRNKFAHTLIYRIRHDIRRQGLAAGDRLGSETDLIRNYDVSRSILREALRILELIGITESRTGPYGGVFVDRADPDNTVEAAGQFLEQSDLPYEQIYEVRLELDTFATELAAERRTEAQTQNLDRALAAESGARSAEEFAAAAGHLHNAICAAAHNRVIGLYVNVLISSKLFRFVHEQQLRKLMDNRTILVRSHERIIRAIKARDAEQASRHMLDHRAQVGRLLRL